MDEPMVSAWHLAPSVRPNERFSFSCSLNQNAPGQGPSCRVVAAVLRRRGQLALGIHGTCHPLRVLPRQRPGVVCP